MTTSRRTDTRDPIQAAAALGPLGTLTLELWQRTRIDWGFAAQRLSAEFRRRRLGGSERRTVSEILYGMIRHARRVDEALSRGGARAASAAPDYDRLLAYLVLEEGLAPADAARHRPEIAWDRVADVDASIAARRDPRERLALRHSLPDWLAARLAGEWGEEAESLAAGLNERAPMTMRVNRLRADPEEAVRALADEGVTAARGRLAPSAVLAQTRTNLFSLGAFRRGLFEAQDEGSQLVAELVAPPERPVIVDYCAGAGGKTLALAALAENRGRVLAADTDSRKLQELRRRARRMGATNIQSVDLGSGGGDPPPKPLARVLGRADRVLVDAPCTGIGALRRNPEARWRLDEGDAPRLAELQLEICERALPLVAPGGWLIYATCTLLHEENQGVVAALRAAHPELEVVRPAEIWGEERAAAVSDASGAFLQLAPHRHGTDGFFAAVLRVPGS